MYKYIISESKSLGKSEQNIPMYSEGVWTLTSRFFFSGPGLPHLICLLTYLPTNLIFSFLLQTNSIT